MMFRYLGRIAASICWLACCLLCAVPVIELLSDRKVATIIIAIYQIGLILVIGALGCALWCLDATKVGRE